MTGREGLSYAAGAQGSVDLCWIPLGSGDKGRCVRGSGRAYEALIATWQRRDPVRLYHSALIVRLDGALFTIEMAPVWAVADSRRGVVAEGPVGLRLLGRSRFFRYEIRCWRDGTIPDLGAAVDSPRRVSSDHVRARRVVDLVPLCPRATWGRDEQRTGDMWNSNSLIAWLLARSGHDMEAEIARPPRGGRAPGWSAGLVVAAGGRGDLAAAGGPRDLAAAGGPGDLAAAGEPGDRSGDTPSHVSLRRPSPTRHR